MRTIPALMTGAKADAEEAAIASFRDPGGRVLLLGERVLRVVHPCAVDGLERFRLSRSCQRFLETDRLVGTRLLLEEEESAFAPEDGCHVMEHERIPFPSFPYEWPPEMLHAAGVLTLDFCESLLEEGLGLKDATPYNVLFQGPRPVFIDWLSFEGRDPHDPTWHAYAQFCRTFLLPLAVNRHLGMPLDQLLLGRRDGLDPEEAYHWAGLLKRWTPPFLSLVSIPKWLAWWRRPEDGRLYRKRHLTYDAQARFVLQSLFRRLRRSLNRLAPDSQRISRWSEYQEHSSTYSPGQLAAKKAFVEGTLRDFTPAWVLDIGANTGCFSAIAASNGASVVAIDSDPVAAGRAWREARSAGLDVLPLVVDVARPTPATGWRNSECPSFLQRSRGRFDGVLMLAVLHHLLVAERVPLNEVIDLAAGLTRDLLVIEFVGVDDQMFRRIARGRDELHRALTLQAFENACRRRFDIVRSMRLEGMSRWLYALRRKRT